MKHFFVLLMSLFSLLFGCNTKKAATPKPQEYPFFPETDNPEVKITPVTLDSGYWISSFFIPEDKQHVYVLGYKALPRKMIEGIEPDPSQVQQADFRLYRLDSKGQVELRSNLPRTDLGAGTFGLLDGQLMLRIDEEFLVLDPEKFTVKEKIPVHDSQYHAAEETEMTFDEHRDDYQAKFDAVLKNPAACRFLFWTPGGEYLVVVQTPKGKRSAWSPPSYEDELIADLKSRFEPLVVQLNPKANDPYDENSPFLIEDGPAKIHELARLSAGTQLVYPNYKSRSVLQYEMSLGDKKIHFSTTDKNGHDLHLHFADNGMLTTGDGAAWVKYESVLYRVE